jgi:3-hydroxyisobutyrate dehydrogenase
MSMPEGGGAGPVLAFIGLGNMGAPMSARLSAAGFSVQGFDVSEVARAALDEAGGSSRPDVASAVDGADIVILMLPNSQIVESVLDSAGFRDSVGAGALVVDMSSSEPMRTRELAGRLAERGVRLVDAPVSGGVSGARTGKLTIMAGGTDEDVAEADTALQVLGHSRHVGPVGSGHAIKALNNLLSATHLWVTSEAMIVGEQFGLDPQIMLDVFNGSSGRSGSTDNKWPNFILPETYNSGFGLRLMLKDMRIAVDLAEKTDAPSRLGADAVRLWAEAAEGMPAGADHTEVARWIRANRDHPTGSETPEHQ